MQVVGNPPRAAMLDGAQVIRAGCVDMIHRLIKEDMDHYIETLQRTPGDTYQDVGSSLRLAYDKTRATKMMALSGALLCGIGAIVLPTPPIVSIALGLAGVGACATIAVKQSHAGQKIASDYNNFETWTGEVMRTHDVYAVEAAKIQAQQKDKAEAQLQKLKESLASGLSGIEEGDSAVAIGDLKIPTA